MCGVVSLYRWRQQGVARKDKRVFLFFAERVVTEGKHHEGDRAKEHRRPKVHGGQCLFFNFRWLPLCSQSRNEGSRLRSPVH